MHPVGERFSGAESTSAVAEVPDTSNKGFHGIAGSWQVKVWMGEIYSVVLIAGNKTGEDFSENGRTSIPADNLEFSETAHDRVLIGGGDDMANKLIELFAHNSVAALCPPRPPTLNGSEKMEVTALNNPAITSGYSEQTTVAVADKRQNGVSRSFRQPPEGLLPSFPCFRSRQD